ncbi:transcription factor 21 [Callorhinchus milii]|uniref:BHLH domain-containing protein n=1 Tax=Callorhinchus milii TaxID=7868 RepID=A0A4W3GLC4_CALMI|nr:transcription factor 21 [Callorhinchus milii]|eukprot:gi/632940150/ref/XP_007885164.1/ PREDICTED: musculin [Callorhinchus milii]
MSTGSISECEDMQAMEIRGLLLQCNGLKHESTDADFYSSAENTEGSSSDCSSKRKRPGGNARKKQLVRARARGRSRGRGRAGKEEKQSQRNAANARERARMRVLSKAFSRLKTSLPWVPPDTKLSKLDTLRLAASYIAHLRQILADDKYENGYVHPVNLTWPFVVSGRPETDSKDLAATSILCGTTV